MTKLIDPKARPAQVPGIPWPTDTGAQAAHSNLGCTVQPIEIGQQAWDRLRTCQSFNDWLLVGQALLVGRTEAMRTANTNKPEGRRYNEEFSDWLKVNKFADIDKSIRSRLFDCLAHRDEIEKWRATLTTGERLKLNHPAAVLRRWQNSTTKKPDAPPKPSAMAKLKEANITLQEENARMAREIKNGGGDLWAPEDTAKDIAKIIVQKVPASKARAIARELSKLANKAEQEVFDSPQAPHAAKAKNPKPLRLEIDFDAIAAGRKAITRVR